MAQDSGGLNLYERVSDEYSLVVNCAGEMYLPVPFSTLNRGGRVDYYLLYLVQGNMDIQSGEGWTEIHPGTAVIFYPGRPYSYRNKGNEPIRYFFVHFTGADARKIVAECGFLNASPCKIGVKEKWIEIIENISREMLGRSALCTLSGCHLLMELLLDMQRSGSDASATDLFRSREYIARHYAEPLSIGALAQMEHLSVSRYRARFRAVSGTSPKEYLLGIRLNKSMELLAGTNLSVGEVAELVGFGDPLYFSRIFKNKIGVSPTAYRHEQ